MENIEENLRFYSDERFQYKIAITHHHPIKHANIGSLYKDSDVIEKGDSLLKLIESNGFQIFIHGHKHIPRLVYYNSLPILSSGSFSSLMNLMETGNKNMFHLITLYPNNVNGKVLSYQFTNGLGWSNNFKSFDFPMHTGFGNRSSVNEIASQFAEYFRSSLQ